MLRIIFIFIISILIASCATTNAKSDDSIQTKIANKQNIVEIGENGSNSDKQVFVPSSGKQEINYKEAAKINAELTIIYSYQGLLDRAKQKLIRAKKINKESKLELPIVGYAEGYYYQSIGAKKIAENKYKQTLSDNPNDYNSINFYAQFLCTEKKDYAEAEEMFEKSIFISNNNDMAQTLFLYSECLYTQGKLADAIGLMEKANKFRRDYLAGKLRLSEMYFEKKEYRKAYSTLYSMKNNSDFFNNKRVLNLRLKLAELAKNKNEAATVRLILSSKDFNEDDDINDFFVDSQDLNKQK